MAATDNNATVSFSGTWASSAVLGAFGGTVSSSSVAGSFATLPTGFSGSAVALVSTLGPDRGVAEITVDGQIVATFDLFAPTLQAGQIVWSTSGLAPGAHTIKVSQLGTRQAASLSTRVDVDAFIALK